MASSFFRDLLDQIVERGRVLRAFSLGGEDHGGTIETLSMGLLSGRGESSGMVVARHILSIFNILTEDEKTGFFQFLNDGLCPDAGTVSAAATAYLAEPSAKTLGSLQTAVESPRQEFFRRLNLAPGGTHQIVRMREALLDRLRDHPELKPVDDDLVHLFRRLAFNCFLKVVLVPDTTGISDDATELILVIDEWLELLLGCALLESSSTAQM